jgi:hypothetical protein
MFGWVRGLVNARRARGVQPGRVWMKLAGVVANTLTAAQGEEGVEVQVFVGRPKKQAGRMRRDVRATTPTKPADASFSCSASWPSSPQTVPGRG